MTSVVFFESYVLLGLVTSTMSRKFDLGIPLNFLVVSILSTSKFAGRPFQYIAIHGHSVVYVPPAITEAAPFRPAYPTGTLNVSSSFPVVPLLCDKPYLVG
jgi:hypothetical protein